MTLEEYDRVVKQKLDHKRYRHCVNVARQAKLLAERYNADKNAAIVAGLLHDITKQDNSRQQLQTIQNGAIILSNVEKRSPNLFHAISGSIYIRQKLGVTNEDIRNAVRYHTTARAGMSKLEKIIYLADLTSADRDYPDVDQMRAVVLQDLDEAMRQSLQFIIPDLVRRNLLLHPDTIAAYNEYFSAFQPAVEE